MKLNLTLFYLLLFSFISLFILSSAAPDPIAVNSWILFQKENGVEFYIQHKSSTYDTRYNTLVRLRNTNKYEVKVSFTPSFGCEKNNDNQELQAQGRIQTAIYPRHSVTLLAYRPCQGNIPDKIVFTSLDVRQR